MPLAGNGCPCGISLEVCTGNELPGTRVAKEFLVQTSYKGNMQGAEPCTSPRVQAAEREGTGRQDMEADLLDSDQKM